MIHPAATVIVVRPRAEDGQPLVYLTQRHPDMRFLANYIVFPGGNVDPADCAAAWQNHIGGRSPAAIAEQFELPVDEAVGYWVAALRELCEEAGLVLAYPAGGQARAAGAESLPEATRRQWQTALVQDEADFLSLVTAAGATLSLDRLYYLDRRIGPPGAKVRYDTRYFLTVLPADQEPIPCEREVARAFWMTPGDALAAWERQELLMVPPTVATLRTLAAFNSIDALMAAAARPEGLKMQSFPPFF